MTLMVITGIIALSEAIFILYLKREAQHVTNGVAVVPRDTSKIATATSLCTSQPAPDGTMSQVCTPQMIEGMPAIQLIPSSMINDMPALLSAGTGTTTLKKETPLNDILIAETASPFASLRNARYTIWPYPNEVAFKEIYLVLPDVYEPIFAGYSNHQFIVSQDGVKHVMLYLRHKESADVGADTRVFVQSPVTTDDADHPLTELESDNGGAIYSLVKNRQEILVEITYISTASSSIEAFRPARAELLRHIAQMEIIW